MSSYKWEIIESLVFNVRSILVLFIALLILLLSNRINGQCNPTCSDNNTFFGMDVGTNTTGTYNSFFGLYAGYGNTSGRRNSFFGTSAGRDNTSGEFNSFFGYTSGVLNSTGKQNAFFGYQSGRDNTTGNLNTFIGAYAGINNETGAGNVFLGGVAAYNNTTGSLNTIVGENAGRKNTTGSLNTFIGNNAGYENTASEYNSFYGAYAFRKLATGSRNTALGASVGRFVESGSLNVIIGYGAGPTTSTINNRLFIDVDNDTSTSGNDNPLIYGEFDNDFVKINGTFEVTAGLSNPSSRSLKQEFVKVESSDILRKLSELDIQQWTYKHRPEEKHIGAIAEDFYAAFGLGEGEKNISTIDADGVMMLAIQALTEENKILKTRLDTQDKLLEDILEKLKDD